MKRLKIVLQSKYLYVFLLLFLILYVFITTKLIKYESHVNSSVIEGTVVSINYNEDKISFVLKAKEKIKCTYYLKENEILENLLGKKIKVEGIVKYVSNNTIPNTFNYKKYLYNNKIYLNFQVNSIEILNNENIFYKLRNKITEKINTYDDDIKTYLNLFILGNKELLDENIYENYRINGIWHLFAVSGMHINLIISVLDKLLKRIKIKSLLISGVLFYFMFLTNFSAPVLRTTIFYFIKNILNFFHIKLDNKKILFLTAFVILLINPFMMYNTGFQYSFLITLSIMLESKHINGNYFVKIFKISLISFIVSLPITIYMNYEINLLSMFLNIFYVPLISLVVFPLSILSFFIYPLSNILKYLVLILEYTNKIFYSLKLCLIIPKMSIIFIIIYFVFLAFYYKTRLKRYLFFITVLISINVLIPKLDNNYYIYYLDVGQGDSSLLITPYKKEIIMIDTGGLINSNYQVSDNIMLFLKSLGISKINTLIITHGDYDHMGDAINIVGNFKVEKVIFNCGEFNELEQDLIKVLDKKKIPYYSCIKELNIDNNKLYFLNNKGYGNENDNSSVIYTELENHKFLFMGDAGADVEEDLIQKYNLQDIDVLKVGHHGSKTSSSKEFVNEINPEHSIISVGKNNRYGHPNDIVLENLNNSKIYRTDQDGSILFKIKNNKLKIKTCAS